MTFIISQAATKDISALAAIHVASKQAAYAGIVNQEVLETKTQIEYEQKWQKWLSEEGVSVSLLFDGDDLRGFISYGRMQTPPPGTSKIRPQYTAEIFAIHVHPEHWRQGYGGQLFKHAAEILKDDKHQSLCLWVLGKNERATKFYDMFGGQRLGKRDVEVGSNKLKELCYGWRDIEGILTS